MLNSVHIYTCKRISVVPNNLFVRNLNHTTLNIIMMVISSVLVAIVVILLYWLNYELNGHLFYLFTFKSILFRLFIRQFLTVKLFNSSFTGPKKSKSEIWANKKFWNVHPKQNESKSKIWTSEYNDKKTNSVLGNNSPEQTTRSKATEHVW
jgi:hypothetical protein